MNVANQPLLLDLKVGSNINLPTSRKFDIIYSSAALYYLEHDNIEFIKDILVPLSNLLNDKGLFVATFAKSDTHYIKNATPIKKTYI